MTAVHISATFSNENRPNNGLEAIADELIADELTPRWIVACVVPHAYSKKAGEELSPTVRLIANEVVTGDDAVAIQKMMDERRTARKLGNFEGSLFDSDGWARDKPADA